MKHVFLLPFLALVGIAGSPEKIDIRIWSRILHDLSLTKYNIYTQDEKIRAVFSKIPGTKFIDGCRHATLVIDTKKKQIEEEECRFLPHMSDDYRIFLKNRNQIGAFFWMKGRPTILFSGPRLKKFGIVVESELEEFVEEIE